MAKLTIGMAHYDDWDGVYFTLQALRLYHARAMANVELVVVDNTPGSKSGEMVRDFVSGQLRQNCAAAKYVPFGHKIGTSAPRNEVFRQASSDWVFCMDCHVLLWPGVVERILEWTAAGADALCGIFSGPMVYDDMRNISTHFNNEWREEMWGTWGQAWRCCKDFDFSCLEIKQPKAPSIVSYRGLAMDSVAITVCPACGRQFPPGYWGGHEGRVVAGGSRPLGLSDDDPVFPIPGMGLGAFLCRKDVWPGFNKHAEGFGGEELVVHEKMRQAGGDAYCVPWMRWMHRFGHPSGSKYHITQFAKVRNYILGFNEIGRDLDSIHAHFVATGLMKEDIWDHLVADPVRHKTAPQPECAGCGADAWPEAITIEDLFQAACNAPRDLDKHLPKLRELAEMCDTVTEITKRRESTLAFLAASPKQLVSYQVEQTNMISRAAAMVPDVEFTAEPIDSLSIESIEPTDMLFVDSTAHTFARASHELEKYGDSVERFIVYHDTHLHGLVGEDRGPGLLAALRVFMEKNPKWSVVYHTTNQYGLTVLGCDARDKPKLPSVVKMATNLAKHMASHVWRGMGHTTQEEMEARLRACTMCEQRVNEQCSVCGCVLIGDNGKAALSTMVCDLGKWPVLDQGDQK